MLVKYSWHKLLRFVGPPTIMLNHVESNTGGSRSSLGGIASYRFRGRNHKRNKKKHTGYIDELSNCETSIISHTYWAILVGYNYKIASYLVMIKMFLKMTPSRLYPSNNLVLHRQMAASSTSLTHQVNQPFVKLFYFKNEGIFSQSSNGCHIQIQSGIILYL